jgi:microcystin-dependent protein
MVNINSKKGIKLEATSEGNVENNSIFLDNSDNTVKIKGNSGSFNSIDVVPVGSVFPWLKSYTNTPSLPSNWIECNGQTLNDSESVYNGQIIPNLNGQNRFLRGSSTSGSVGGADTHTLTVAEMPSHSHVYKGGANVGAVGTSGSGNNNNNTSSTGGGNAHNNLPSYYEVVYIIKIK